MTQKKRKFAGRCHCGNIEIVFETARTPEELGVRSCTCSFCARHGAITTTDPEGGASFVARDRDKLNRYRFGLKTADFLVCGVCGVYVGAVFADGERSYATLNVNAFEERGVFPRVPEFASYDHETEGERRARRVARWTPVLTFDEGVG